MDHQIREISYWKNVKSKMRLQPFVHAVESSAVPIAIADPYEADCPLVFVNDAFLKLTGYEEHEVLGRNCRFLQGPETRDADRQALKDAVRDKATISREILNYRKDGSSFWNELHMAPMLDDHGDLLYFIATQVDVTERMTRTENLRQELDEKTTALRDQAERTHHMAREMTHREIHRIIEHGDHDSKIEIGQIISSICEKLDHISRAQVVSSADRIEIGEELVTPIALIVSELVTNAQKHAYGQEDGGIIAVTARRNGEDIALIVRDDGRGLPADFDPRAVSGFGMKMLLHEIDHLKAELRVERGEKGTAFIVEIPMQPEA